LCLISKQQGSSKILEDEVVTILDASASLDRFSRESIQKQMRYQDTLVAYEK